MSQYVSIGGGLPGKQKKLRLSHYSQHTPETGIFMFMLPSLHQGWTKMTDMLPLQCSFY